MDRAWPESDARSLCVADLFMVLWQYWLVNGAVEDAAPWKSPRTGLFPLAWKSRKCGGISTSPTAPAAAVTFERSTTKPMTEQSQIAL
jgi:hypothetical protein